MLIELTKRYLEPHRKYHTLKHINDMFVLASINDIKLSDEQIMAIWFHDIVYNIPVNENMSNEKASSLIASSILNAWGCDINVHIVCRIIEDTEYPHIPAIEESKIVLDLDLSGLGLNYWDNRKLIQEEMLTYYSKEEFYIGRLKWLKHMFDRDEIFLSGHFDDLEEDAKYDIQTEINAIEKGKRW